MKRLDMSSNSFEDIMNFNQFIELVRVAGNSGITDFNLSSTEMVNAHLTPDDLFLMVKTAGTSGIKRFVFNSESLSSVLGFDGFKRFIEIA